MNKITLQQSAPVQTTVVSNRFIDDYMPRANGEFVKVYLGLLRTMKGAQTSFQMDKLADQLLCTEKDILRALRYWEKEGLMTLTFGADQSLRAIAFTGVENSEKPSAVASPAPAASVTLSSLSQIASAASVPPSPVPSSKKSHLTPDRVAELKKSDTVRMLLFSAEQYLGKPLTPTDIQKLLFFYDDLQMSPELIEYLIEYSVSRNHKSLHYMEAVALAWKEAGIRNVEDAKKSASLFQKDYYTILKSMGIQNRNPVEEEVTFMNTWLHQYGFDLPIILEACSRTVMKLGQASFPYADKILSEWHANKAHTLDAIKVLDDDFRKKQKARTFGKKNGTKDGEKESPKPSSNRFNNFHQRDYDFNDFEKQLLGGAPKSEN
ncbi:MAG: DnaD domain protein [Eubacteriales bacterium]|nr:DnaD domain protein [Eubacteriales bacterium]